MISGEIWSLFNAVTKDIGNCIVFASDQLVTHVTGIQRDSKFCYVCLFFYQIHAHHFYPFLRCV